MTCRSSLSFSPCRAAWQRAQTTGQVPCKVWPPLARAPLPLAPLYLKPRRQNESASLSCHRARTCTKALIRLPARRTDTLCTLTRWLTVAPCDLRFVRVQFFVYFLLCRFCWYICSYVVTVVSKHALFHCSVSCSGGCMRPFRRFAPFALFVSDIFRYSPPHPSPLAAAWVHTPGNARWRSLYWIKNIADLIDSEKITCKFFFIN